MVFASGPGGIGAVAVALDDGGRRGSAWIAVEKVGDASLGEAFAQVIEDAATGNVRDPEVAGLDLPLPG